MAKRNDMLESHSAKEKFPQSDKLSAKNSPHRSHSGRHDEVESENHPTQPQPNKPMRQPTERPCALRLWSYRLTQFVAELTYGGDFPQAMRQ